MVCNICQGKNRGCEKIMSGHRRRGPIYSSHVHCHVYSPRLRPARHRSRPLPSSLQAMAAAWAPDSRDRAEEHKRGSILPAVRPAGYGPGDVPVALLPGLERGARSTMSEATVTLCVAVDAPGPGPEPTPEEAAAAGEIVVMLRWAQDMFLFIQEDQEDGT